MTMSQEISARVVRISGGLCWADAGSGGEPVQCLARGNVKKRSGGVMVGDLSPTMAPAECWRRCCPDATSW